MIEVLKHNLDLSPLKNGYGDFVKRWNAEEESEFNDGRFHASDLGKCIRQAILKRAGFTGRPLTEEEETNFAEANFIHAGMTNFWMRNGTALAREQRFDDLPLELHEGKLAMRLASPYPGWTGKFDAMIHRPEWCGCKKPTKELASVWDVMVQMHNRQDEDWIIYRDVIKAHDVMPGSLKTVAPYGLKHYVSGPKLHNVWQDSLYVDAINETYGLAIDKIVLMYRGRGGGGRPIFWIVKALDAGLHKAEYDRYWTHWEEDGGLPDVLDLVAEFENDKTYGEVVRIGRSWECRYCRYAGWTDANGGFRCEPMKTKNEGSDRIAVVGKEVVVVVEEWCNAAKHEIHDVVNMVVDLVDRSDQPDRMVDTSKTARGLKGK